MFTLKHLLLFHPSTYKHIKAGEVKAGNVKVQLLPALKSTTELWILHGTNTFCACALIYSGYS